MYSDQQIDKKNSSLVSRENYKTENRWNKIELKEKEKKEKTVYSDQQIDKKNSSLVSRENYKTENRWNKIELKENKKKEKIGETK